jgi:hypothetical protein
MSDAQLKDIGLVRAQIETAARVGMSPEQRRVTHFCPAVVGVGPRFELRPCAHRHDYTQADITPFRFDAAGAPAEHVRCRRYRVDGRHTLREAIAVCEAMQLLASPDSLGGTERQREMNLAEDIGKERI